MEEKRKQGKERFTVEGMTCAACQMAVQKAVSRLDGVKEVTVSLMTNSMDVTYDHDQAQVQDIIQAVDKAGYSAWSQAKKEGKTQEESSASAIFLKQAKNMQMRLKVSLPFLALLMYLSMGPMVGLPIPSFLEGAGGSVSYALSQVLVLLPILYVNRSYFINGFKSLRNKSPNMDALIAIGAMASLLYGIFALYRMSYGLGFDRPDLVHLYMHELYFESAGTILTLITVGKYLEVRSKLRTTSSLEKLMDLQAKSAIVLEDGKFVEKPIEEVKKGDLVLVKPGDRVPLDGVIRKGESSIDESAMTGESLPVYKQPGDRISAGTVNKTGACSFEVTAVGEDTGLSQIIRLVEDANATKAPIQAMVDKVAGIFVPVVISIALVTFAFWMFRGESLELALRMAISVLVISCPCALGLATPVVIMVATGKGAEQGILIKSAEALEEMSDIQTIYFDKTGTITEGRPELTDLFHLDGEDSKEVLREAASLEQFSEQPLAESVVSAAKKEGLDLYEVENFQAIPGHGIKGEVVTAQGKKSYAAGNGRMMEKEGLDPSPYQETVERLAQEAKTPMFFAANGKITAILAAADRVKEGSKEAIQALKEREIATVLISGDNKQTAQAVAQDVGLSDFHAEVLPADKESILRRGPSQGKIAMVGDGINDAPALARADVGIAIGAGTDVAIESADVVLMHSDLRDVVQALDLSKRTKTKIKQNLFWAFFYNAICIPLAAGVFYPKFGLTLNPMIASAAMSLSSVFVVLNALSLSLFQGQDKKPKERVDQTEFQVQVSLLQAPERLESERSTAWSGWAESSPADEKEEKKEENKMKKVLHIEGMSCGHCKMHVEKALNSLDGVKAEVNLEKNLAEVEVDASISDAAMEEAVQDAGYQVTAIENN